MQIYFINNDGGGFARPIEIPTGMTISQLFALEMRNRQAEDS